MINIVNVEIKQADPVAIEECKPVLLRKRIGKPYVVHLKKGELRYIRPTSISERDDGL